MKSKILQEKMQLWLKCKYNVLFEGPHGVGKTSLMTQAFKDAGLCYKYFSASTIDPWVDFVGVPKEVKHSNGKTYLELIRPREFEDDEIDIIFFDEFNRAPAKVRNAVMELMQFKSINGRKFNNLQCIWAAINPVDDEETYSVERLDPAQQDRFHIFYKLPNTPSPDFFNSKYGTIGTKACQWWDILPETYKPLVSPRRLEYAVDAYNNGVDLADVLPDVVRPKTLKTMIEMVDDQQITHIDRWRQDPDLYINELTSRTFKNDIIEAYEALLDVSLDLAVKYLDHLTPKQLTQIAENPKLRYLLFKSKDSKTIRTALKSIPIYDITSPGNLLNIHNRSYYFTLITNGDDNSFQGVLREMQYNTIPNQDEACCIILMCSKRRKHTNNLIASTIDEIGKLLFTLVGSQYPNMLAVDPIFIYNCLQSPDTGVRL